MAELSADILLVEDNPAHVELILLALRKEGVAERTHVARDGVEALDYLFSGDPPSTSSCLPRLVLLDLKMPRVNGLEVLARVKSDRRTQSIPVICMTSSQDDRDIRESYRLGANSYILKPVNYAEWARAISSLVAYWLQLNLLPA
ncbi:MAG: response regulator [Candidatus Sumerlaeia bacterium]|nr:response regulator [Candidatus Sumerlaeia bacterium]